MSQIDLDVRAASTTGLEPSFAAALAYLAGPFSGLIMLLAEPTNQYVRFHAWQAFLGLGALGLLAALCLLSAFLGLFLSPSMFRTLNILSAVLAVAWLIAWALCLVKAFGGNAWKLPLVGAWAERRVLKGAQRS